MSPWDALGDLVNDEVLGTFAVVCENLDDVPATLKARYGALVDNWQCSVETGDRDRQRELLQAVRAA